MPEQINEKPVAQAANRTRIFISYAHTDSTDLAYKLRTELQNRCYEVWLDESDLHAGSEWSIELDEHLENSDVVLALISEAASHSRFCRGEQLKALDKKKYVIPIVAQPGIDLPAYCYGLQYQDFSRPELFNLNVLVRAIENRGGVVVPPEPPENKFLFQVDSFDVGISVDPLAPEKQEYKAEYFGSSRIVHSDNHATIRRTIKFSDNNTCTQIFQMSYRTRSSGFVRPNELDDEENEATPEDVGRYADTGTEATFKVTPHAGKTYTWEVEVWGGFDQGNRNMHFHIPNNMRCKEYRLTLDLSAYLAEGWKVTEGPNLYFDPKDRPDHKLCALRKRAENQLAPAESVSSGIWNWKIKDFKGGIVDLIWDLAEPGAK
jgi:hypothetical protein